jgi:hypothetical protein
LARHYVADWSISLASWSARGALRLMLQDLIAEAQIECEEHGSKNQVAPVPRAPAKCPFEHAVRVAVPWSLCLGGPAPAAPRFPGMRRYLEQLLPGAQYGAIIGWRFGRRNPPDWAIDALAAHLDRTARQASEAARLLRESKKPAQTRTGLRTR